MFGEATRTGQGQVSGAARDDDQGIFQHRLLGQNQPPPVAPVSLSLIGVSISPGSTAFTRILSLAHSRAAVLVRERNGAKSNAMTVSPSLSSRSAVALPIPLAAPVTSAIRRAAIIALLPDDKPRPRYHVGRVDATAVNVNSVLS